MLPERLRLALDSGRLALPPEGVIAVIGARAGTDLSALPNDRVEVVSRHFPDHRAFREQGYRTAIAPAGPYALAILCLPRARAEARAALAAVRAATQGTVVVDGQKTDGIDGMLREIRARAATGAPLAKAHGKLFVVEGGDFGDWRDAPGPQVAGGFRTAPGAFSADGIDPGSEALARALPPLAGTVVDLGAGWGYLSTRILAAPGVTAIHLVEADHAALEAARANIADPRARFHWADARDWRPPEPADHVVTNPPFHTTRAANPGLGQDFIRAAAAILGPRGRLWLVGNRHLPYEKTLDASFRDVRVLGQSPQYKLFAAALPRKAAKG